MSSIDERVSALEAEIAELKRRLQEPPPLRPNVIGRTHPDFLDTMFGIHANSPHFEEMSREIAAEREHEREEADGETNTPPAISALDVALQQALNRTDADKRAAWESIYATARPARPLASGETLETVIVGKWPGDETDEEIEAALADLS